MPVGCPPPRHSPGKGGGSGAGGREARGARGFARGQADCSSGGEQPAARCAPSVQRRPCRVRSAEQVFTVRSGFSARGRRGREKKPRRGSQRPADHRGLLVRGAHQGREPRGAHGVTATPLPKAPGNVSGGQGKKARIKKQGEPTRISQRSRRSRGTCLAREILRLARRRGCPPGEGEACWPRGRLLSARKSGWLGNLGIGIGT
mmetsp:Transcript_22362/g.47957  ORF Transcript_22362/g.47957 Transcript_22362/m.47957 type:complete len:204 (+) Transcript_22362:315-926(+)